MTQMYETDQLNRTLIVGGHKADLWASDDGYLVTEHNSTNPIEQGLTGTEALELYNELNGTRLQPSFKVCIWNETEHAHNLLCCLTSRRPQQYQREYALNSNTSHRPS